MAVAVLPYLLVREMDVYSVASDAHKGINICVKTVDTFCFGAKIKSTSVS
jgi:hypothetical protein